MESKASSLIANVLEGKAEDFMTFQRSYEELNQLLVKSNKSDRDKVVQILLDLLNQKRIKVSYHKAYTEFIENLNQRKSTKKPEVEYERSIKSELITFDPLSNPWQLYIEDRLQANEKLEPEQLKVMDQASGAAQLFTLLEKRYLLLLHHFFNPSIWMERKDFKIQKLDFSSEESAKKAAKLCRGLEKYQLCRNRILSKGMNSFHGKVWEDKMKCREKMQAAEMKRLRTMRLVYIASYHRAKYLKNAFYKLLAKEPESAFINIETVNSSDKSQNEKVKSVNSINSIKGSVYKWSIYAFLVGVGLGLGIHSLFRYREKGILKLTLIN